ncbi:MAG: hypothetical protein HFF17_12465 [Oscillospiraceae bacterium]|nr:hypothetical protein [Oscillospiraceae bacterium]
MSMMKTPHSFMIFGHTAVFVALLYHVPFNLSIELNKKEGFFSQKKGTAAAARGQRPHGAEKG